MKIVKTLYVAMNKGYVCMNYNPDYDEYDLYNEVELDGYIFDDVCETDRDKLMEACEKSVLSQATKEDTVELYTDFIGLSYVAVIDYCRSRNIKMVNVHVVSMNNYMNSTFQVATHYCYFIGDPVITNHPETSVKMRLSDRVDVEAEYDIVTTDKLADIGYEALKYVALEVLKFFKKSALEIYLDDSRDLVGIIPVVDACRHWNIPVTFHLCHFDYDYDKDNNWKCVSEQTFSLWTN